MSASPYESLLLLLPALAMLAVGGAMLWLGLRGRRVGSDPHCRKCGYVLIGIDAERCPECGADLRASRAVELGRRVRRRGLVGAAVALGLVAVLILTAALSPLLRNYDWYRLMPTGWVIDRLEVPSAPVSNRAWAELKRRMKADDLAARHRTRLAEKALADQAAGTPGELLDWLGRAILDGKIDNVRKDRFFKQSMVLHLRARPRVVLGDDIPYQITTRSRGPVASEGWWQRVEYLGVTLDGKPVPGGAGGSSGSSGFGAGGSAGSWIPCDASGRHILRAVVRVRIFHGGTNLDEHDPAARLMDEREVKLAATTEVLPQAVPGYVAAVDDPNLAKYIRKGIALTNFESGPGRKGLSGEISVSSGVPVALAFDAFVRAGGRESRLTSITLPRGGSTTFRVHDRDIDLGDAREIDVVLRGSEAVARRTVDLFEFWNGELVFEAVPVTDRR